MWSETLYTVLDVFVEVWAKIVLLVVAVGRRVVVVLDIVRMERLPIVFTFKLARKTPYFPMLTTYNWKSTILALIPP